jgi:hypothetical protein
MASAIIIDNTKSGHQQFTSFDLKGLTIAFSISNSENIAEFSFNQNDLDNLFLRLARLILSIEGNIVYGGDLRPNGFTEQLKELARSYSETETDSKNRFIHLKVPNPSEADTDEYETTLANDWVKMIEISPPENSEWGNSHVIQFAESLTKMRNEAAAHYYDAIIIMGGQHKNNKGFIPGIVEEFIAAFEYNRPIYLVGCFGGAAQLLFQYFFRQDVDALALLLPLESSITLSAIPESKAKIIDRIERHRKQFELRRKIILQKGDPSIILRNGLSSNDNFTLATTRNPQTMSDLILKGLYHVKQKH